MRPALAWLALLLTLGSCATVPTPATQTAASPMPGRQAPATSAGSTTTREPAPSPMPGGAGSGSGRTAAQTPAVVDSQPSRDALEVLKSIPEPLAPGEHVPAPSRSALVAADSSGAPADSAQADSSAVPGERDSVQVPIPSLTVPLGDRPGSLVHRADSLAAGSGAPAGATPSSPPPATSPAAPTSPPKVASPDSCWRIQVAAKPDVNVAKALRDAAQSQLLVPIVVELDKGLHKVRSRDCMGREAAELLRRRALAAGFAGTFRFKGAPK